MCQSGGSIVTELGRHTTGTNWHRVGIDLVGELSLGADGEDGGGHEGDGALEGRHIDQLTVEGDDEVSVVV
jgi:hypothetical protein